MKFIIISYKTRNSLLTFIKALRQYGVSADIINTPRSISKSCGLSAKILENNLNTAIRVINQLNFKDFFGIYSIERQGFQERLQRLY